MQISDSNSEEDITFVKDKPLTRVDRRKIFHNVLNVPIDGISFHSEDNVQKWKYVVQRRIVDEKVLSDQTKFCLETMDLFQHVGLLKTVHIRGTCFTISSTIINAYLGCVDSPPLGKPYPSTMNLVAELRSGTQSEWPLSGQLSSSTFSVMYAILFQIGIANWCPSIHGSGLSPSPTILLYQIGTLSTFDFGEFLYITSIFDMITPLLSSYLSVYCTFSLGSHVPDIVLNINPPKASNIPFPEDLQWQICEGDLFLV
ncbi:uncharacterized protein LOC120067388 [Benincasa hispida]|uniref:uncharacterized protein LOC120067388 n=1 Tax=Benincasa hispida TaxID=102211 RepID=UPI0019018416|nr:uncharacterized protein LOC120067388 [Benincasa hispida]